MSLAALSEQLHAVTCDLSSLQADDVDAGELAALELEADMLTAAIRRGVERLAPVDPLADAEARLERAENERHAVVETLGYGSSEYRNACRAVASARAAYDRAVGSA